MHLGLILKFVLSYVKVTNAGIFVVFFILYCCKLYIFTVNLLEFFINWLLVVNCNLILNQFVLVFWDYLVGGISYVYRYDNLFFRFTIIWVFRVFWYSFVFLLNFCSSIIFSISSWKSFSSGRCGEGLLSYSNIFVYIFFCFGRASENEMLFTSLTSTPFLNYILPFFQG